MGGSAILDKMRPKCQKSNHHQT